jgi:hypothetical protein
MLGQEQVLLLTNMIKDHQPREQEKLSIANLVEIQNSSVIEIDHARVVF